MFEFDPDNPDKSGRGFWQTTRPEFDTTKYDGIRIIADDRKIVADDRKINAYGRKINAYGRMPVETQISHFLKKIHVFLRRNSVVARTSGKDVYYDT